MRGSGTQQVNNLLMIVICILQIVENQLLISERISFDSLSEEYAKEDEIYRTKIQQVQLLCDFLVTLKAAPHECVIRTGQP